MWTMGPVAARLLGFLALTVVLGGLPASLNAQEVETLSLDRAVEMAVRNNPEYLRRANDRDPANWQVRQAWGSLIPSVSARGNANYTEAGIQRIGTLDFGAQSTDWFSSSYFLGVDWAIDGRTLYGISSARANARSTEAGIRAEEFFLEQRVTLQYMVALRARDGVRVAEDNLTRARENFDIVRSRVQTGAAAGTEATQAEVELGRAEVFLLEAERDAQAELLRLLEELGMDITTRPVELVDEFEIVPPRWTAEELIADAMTRHPSLRSLAAARQAQEAQVKQEWSSYLPRLSLSANFSGNALQALNDDFIVSSARSSMENQFNSCLNFNAINAGIPGGLPSYTPQDCSRFVYTDAMGQQALAANDVFPFDFTGQPASFGLQVSIPIFQGFSRQQNVEQAQARASDAAHNLRAEELRLKTAITRALGDLTAAYRSVEIEERNLELSRQQLTESRQRYTAGAISILELRDAQTTLSTAEQDYLDARYSFHQALVVLEASTGRALRTPVNADTE